MISNRPMTDEEVKEVKSLVSKRKRVEKWLLTNKDYINITGIERSITAPKGLVQKFIKYDKRMNDKWINPLFLIIKEITSFTVK